MFSEHDLLVWGFGAICGVIIALGVHWIMTDEDMDSEDDPSMEVRPNPYVAPSEEETEHVS